MSNGTPDKSLLQSITRIVDSIASEGLGYDHLINILSLLCIITILNRNLTPAGQYAAQPTAASSAGNPLQRLLSELTKSDGGGGGPSPDTLMSLLPLLNSPQLKSKLNPSNMATILGLINSLGGSGSSSEKHEPTKQEKQEKTETKSDSKKDAPAAAVTESMPTTEKIETDLENQEKKSLGRYLNWKTSF